MNCPRCGVRVSEEDLFCLNCGVSLKDIPAQTPYTPQPTVPSQTPYIPQPTVAPQTSTVYNPQPMRNDFTPSAPASAPVTAGNNMDGQRRKEKNTNKILLVIIAVLVMLLAAGVAAFFAMGGTELFSKDESTTALTTAQQGELILPDVNESVTTAGDIYTTSAPSVYPDSTSTTNPYTDSIVATKPHTDSTPPTSAYPDYTQATTEVVGSSGFKTTSSGLMMPTEGNRVGICEAYNNAVNNLKGYNGLVTLHKEETFNFYAEDLPLIVDSVVNGTLANLSVPSDETYTFIGGSDGDGRLLSEKMMPWGRDAQVTEYDVLSANITENEDGGYSITLYFPYEVYYYSEGGVWDEPTSHMTAMDYLDFTAIDFGAISITDADMRYPGAVTEITVDSQGRLIGLSNYMPLEGECTGAYGFVNFELTLIGDITTDYVLTYNN